MYGDLDNDCLQNGEDLNGILEGSFSGAIPKCGLLHVA